MVIRDVSDQYRITLGDLTPPGAPPRTPGVHLSQIVRHIAQANGILKATAEDLGETLPDVERMAAGCAWEDWLAHRLQLQLGMGFLYHPGEFTRDGISGTPDAVELHITDPAAPPYADVLHEFKFTWKGSHKAIEQQWLWWTQLKGYCCLLKVTRGRLHVYYCNSNYANSTRRYYVYDAEFGEQELRETWDMLVRHRDLVTPETGEART